MHKLTKCIKIWLELVESIISPQSAVLPDQLISSIQIHLAALLKSIFHSLLNLNSGCGPAYKVNEEKVTIL